MYKSRLQGKIVNKSIYLLLVIAVCHLDYISPSDSTQPSIPLTLRLRSEPALRNLKGWRKPCGLG